MVAALLSLTTSSAGASATLDVEVSGEPTSFALPDTNGSAADITYTITVTSPLASVPVTLTDTTTGGSVVGFGGPSAEDCSQSGNTVTCDLFLVTAGSPETITVFVDAPEDPGTVTNEATATSTLLGGDTASTSTTITAPADLAVAITGTPGTVEPEQGVLYSVTASNNGGNPAAQVVLTDTTPGGTVDAANSSLTDDSPDGVCDLSDSDADTKLDKVTCEFDNLGVGGTRSIGVAVFAPTSTTVTTMTSTASVAHASSDTEDPVSGNNSASTTTTIDPDAGTGVVRPGECTDADGHELCNNGDTTIIVTAMENQEIDPAAECGDESCPDNALFLDFSTDPNYQGEIVLDLRYGTPPPPCRGPGKPCAEPYISKDGGDTYQRIPPCSETGGETPCYTEIYKEEDGTWHFVIRLQTEDPLLPIFG